MNNRRAQALPQAFFLSTSDDQRFCLLHTAGKGPYKGRVLYLHPFAEEMNASRRVVAQQCRAMAAHGYAVLQIDLLGCGESSGDFGDATWQAWLDDVVCALQWMDEQIPQQCNGPLWLWGLRAGALLACAAVEQRMLSHPTESTHLLLWQPVASGRQQLQQFMRLHAAAQWLGGAASGEAPPLALAAGRHAHIAGYSLSPALANGLENATLDLPTCANGRVVLMELASTSSANAQASPWSERQAAVWRRAGWLTSVQVVPAQAFWQNVAETELDNELCRHTLTALDTEVRA